MQSTSISSLSQDLPSTTNQKMMLIMPTIHGHGHYVAIQMNKYETKAVAKARGQKYTICYSLYSCLKQYLNESVLL